MPSQHTNQPRPTRIPSISGQLSLSLSLPGLMKTMLILSRRQRHFLSWPIFLALALLLRLLRLLLLDPVLADVGSVGYYGPPYTPTACYGSDPSQFPTNNLFGAVGEGIWDKGAACGRAYMVRCLSSATPGACQPDQTVRILVLDQAVKLRSNASWNASTSTMLLSKPAFRQIANLSAPLINIEFLQA